MNRLLGWGMWSVAIFGTLAGVAMIPFTHHLRHYLGLMPPIIRWGAMPLEILSSSIFVVYATVGLLLRQRQPDNPMGWWALSIAVAGGLNTLSGNYTLIAYLVAPAHWWPLASLSAWIEHWMTLAATAIGGVFIPLLFPYGHIPSRRWRPFLYLSSALLSGQILLLAFSEMDILNYAETYQIRNPYGFLTLSTQAQAVLVTALLAPVIGWALRFYWSLLTFALSVLFLLLVWLPAITPFPDISAVVILLGVVISLFRRLQRAKGVELQQIKWLTWSFSLTAIFGAGRIISGGQLTFAGNLFYFAFTFAWILVAVALSLALLQYRLYDIDIIIRKTAIYSVLVGLLSLLFFGSITLTQAIFSALTGQQSAIATVLSTLAIAALFTPLRSRIQDTIDRRFYRRKYDAQQVLAQFAVTARDETDLDSLTAELARVVGETMQPEKVSLWIRKEEGRWT